MSDTETLDSADTDLVDPQIAAAPEPEAADAATPDPVAETPDLSQPPESAPTGQEPVPEHQLTPEDINRLRNFERLAGQQGRELGELRKFRGAYEGLPPAEELRSILEQQKTVAEAANLRAWNPRSPQYHQTSVRLARVDAFAAAEATARERINADPNLDPQTKQATFFSERRALAQAMQVTDEDITLHNEKRQYATQVQEEMASDPDEFVNRRAVAVAQQVFQQMFSQINAQTQAQTQAQQFAEQHKDLIEKRRDEFIPLLAKYGRTEALNILSMKDRLAAYESNAAKTAEIGETAKAQQQSLHRKARVSRDASTEPTFKDPVAMAREKGYLPNTPRYVQFIREETARQQKQLS